MKIPTMHLLAKATDAVPICGSMRAEFGTPSRREFNDALSQCIKCKRVDAARTAKKSSK